MKQISASIIVLAAAVIIVGGSLTTDIPPISHVQPIVLLIGSGVCAVGLWGWVVSLKEK
jgi:hypothetical protein